MNRVEQIADQMRANASTGPALDAYALTYIRACIVDPAARLTSDADRVAEIRAAFDAHELVLAQIVGRPR